MSHEQATRTPTAGMADMKLDVVVHPVSHADHVIKVIAANPVMINAYKEGIPGNGKPVPDAAMIAKIEWSKKKNPESPYSVLPVST